MNEDEKRALEVLKKEFGGRDGDLFTKGINLVVAPEANFPDEIVIFAYSKFVVTELDENGKPEMSETKFLSQTYTAMKDETEKPAGDIMSDLLNCPKENIEYRVHGITYPYIDEKTFEPFIDIVMCEAGEHTDSNIVWTINLEHYQDAASMLRFKDPKSTELSLKSEGAFNTVKKIPIFNGKDKTKKDEFLLLAASGVPYEQVMVRVVRVINEDTEIDYLKDFLMPQFYLRKS